MEPKAGIEPATHALRMRCSTPELLRLEFVGNWAATIEVSSGLSFAFFTVQTIYTTEDQTGNTRAPLPATPCSCSIFLHSHPIHFLYECLVPANPPIPGDRSHLARAPPAFIQSITRCSSQKGTQVRK